MRRLQTCLTGLVLLALRRWKRAAGHGLREHPAVTLFVTAQAIVRNRTA